MLLLMDVQRQQVNVKNKIHKTKLSLLKIQYYVRHKSGKPCMHSSHLCIIEIVTSCVYAIGKFRMKSHRWSITFIDSVPTWNKIKIAAAHAMKAHMCKQCAEARETCVGPTKKLQLPMSLVFSMWTADSKLHKGQLP